MFLFIFFISVGWLISLVEICVYRRINKRQKAFIQNQRKTLLDYEQTIEAQAHVIENLRSDIEGKENFLNALRTKNYQKNYPFMLIDGDHNDNTC